MLKNTLNAGLFIIIAISISLKSQTLHTVRILDETFEPSSLTINVGDTVLWEMSSTIVHTVTSGENCTSSGLFNSGNLSVNQTFVFVFGQEGTFPYYCIPHCHFGMVGEIIVEPAVTQIEDVTFFNESFRIVNPGPNPIQNHGYIEFELSTPSHLSIAFFDVTGRKVLDIADDAFLTGNHHIRFDVSQLPTGIYMQSYFMDGFPVWTRKIVKE
jgi:plastocyanin